MTAAGAMTGNLLIGAAGAFGLSASIASARNNKTKAAARVARKKRLDRIAIGLQGTKLAARRAQRNAAGGSDGTVAAHVRRGKGTKATRVKQHTRKK